MRVAKTTMTKMREIVKQCNYRYENILHISGNIVEHIYKYICYVSIVGNIKVYSIQYTQNTNQVFVMISQMGFCTVVAFVRILLFLPLPPLPLLLLPLLFLPPNS